MEIRTRRWNDPPARGDGARILICRYRPRGLPKRDETWSEWQRDLAPSVELHAAFWGKRGAPIGWGEFKRRYLAEMRAQRPAIARLAERAAGGETLTLLCSSACLEADRCHRSLLAKLIERAAAASPRGRG